MAKEYPMTFEEYEKRVIELLFDGMNPVEKKETENELKDLLEFDSEFIKNLYGGDCYYYDQGQDAFCDELLLSRPVQTILMSL